MGLSGSGLQLQGWWGSFVLKLGESWAHLYAALSRCEHTDGLQSSTSEISGPKASVNLQIEYKPSKAYTRVCVHLLKQSTAVRACVCVWRESVLISGPGVLTTNRSEREQMKWNVCCLLLQESLRPTETKLQTAEYIQTTNQTENHFSSNLCDAYNQPYTIPFKVMGSVHIYIYISVERSLPCSPMLHLFDINTVKQ